MLSRGGAVDIPVVVVQTVVAQRQVWGGNCAKTVDFPRVQFSAVFRGELITQVMSSCKLVSATVVAS